MRILLSAVWFLIALTGTVRADNLTSGKTWGLTFSTGFPHVFFLDYENLHSPGFTWAIGIGGLAIPMKTESGFEARMGVAALDVRTRWHPWEGPLFVGGILGLQSIYAKGSQIFPVSGYGNITALLDANVGGMYFTPHFGWLWVFGSGFTLGLEAGWQIPLGAKTTLDLRSTDGTVNSAISAMQQLEDYKKFENELKHQGDRLGTIGLPYFTVIRVGWVF